MRERTAGLFGCALGNALPPGKTLGLAFQRQVGNRSGRDKRHNRLYAKFGRFFDDQVHFVAFQQAEGEGQAERGVGKRGRSRYGYLSRVRREVCDLALVFRPIFITQDNALTGLKAQDMVQMVELRARHDCLRVMDVR